MPAPSEITPDEWNRIVRVFQMHDGRPHAAARELGWPVARAKRILHRGYPSAGYPPVTTLIGRDHVDADQVRAMRHELEQRDIERVSEQRELAQRTQRDDVEDQARVKQLVARERERDKVKADALASRAEEATLVSAARRNAIALNGVTARIMQGALKLSDRIYRELEAEASSVSSKLSLSERLGLIRSAAQIARFNAEAGLQAVKSERMVLGQSEPSEGDVEQAGSLEDSARWIERSVTALQRAKERGLIAERMLQRVHDATEPAAPAVLEAQVVTPGIQPPVPIDTDQEPDPAGRAELPTADKDAQQRKQRIRTRGKLVAL